MNIYMHFPLVGIVQDGKYKENIMGEWKIRNKEEGEKERQKDVKIVNKRRRNIWTINKGEYRK